MHHRTEWQNVRSHNFRGPPCSSTNLADIGTLCATLRMAISCFWTPIRYPAHNRNAHDLTLKGHICGNALRNTHHLHDQIDLYPKSQLTKPPQHSSNKPVRPSL